MFAINAVEKMAIGPDAIEAENAFKENGLRGLLDVVKDRSAYGKCVFGFCISKKHKPVAITGKMLGKVIPPEKNNTSLYTETDWRYIFWHSATGK